MFLHDSFSFAKENEKRKALLFFGVLITVAQQRQAVQYYTYTSVPNFDFTVYIRYGSQPSEEELREIKVFGADSHGPSLHTHSASWTNTDWARMFYNHGSRKLFRVFTFFQIRGNTVHLDCPGFHNMYAHLPVTPLVFY